MVKKDLTQRYVNSLSSNSYNFKASGTHKVICCKYEKSYSYYV